MKITEQTKQLRVFQIELSEAELREIERCLFEDDIQTKPGSLNYDTWEAVFDFISELDKK